MKAAELISKVQDYAKKHDLSAHAACNRLKIPHGRYYQAVSRARKAKAVPKRAGATVKAATRQRRPEVVYDPVTADGPSVLFIGSAADLAAIVRDLTK